MMDKRCVVRRLRCPECTLLGRVCRGAVSRPPPFSRLRCPRTHGKWPNRKIPQLFITFTTRSTHHGAHLQYTPHTSPQSAVATQSAAQSRPLCRVRRPTVPARGCRSAYGECRSAVCSHCVTVHSRGFRVQSAESGFRFQRVSALYSVCRAASNCRCYRQPPPRPRSAANS